MTAATDAPVASYVAAAAPPGSLDHFALMFAPAATRDALATALALGKVVHNIGTQTTEAEILRLKLAWWHDEIRVARDGDARHPLTKDLAARVASPAWLEPLGRLVAHINSQVGHPLLDSLEAVLRHGHGLAERQALLAVVAGAAHDDDLANARAAGVGIALTELLMAPAGRSPGDIVDSDAEPIAFTAEQLATIARDHFDAMEPATDDMNEPAIVWLQARLHRDALERLVRARFDARRAQIAPLRLLWRAWREARRLRA